MLNFFVDMALVLFCNQPGQQPAKPVHRVERRTQIMRHRVGKSLKFLVRQAQRGFNRLDFGDVRINANPERKPSLSITHRRRPVGHGVPDTVNCPHAPGSDEGGVTLLAQGPVGVQLGHIFRVDDGDPLLARPVLRSSAHQAGPGAIDVGDFAFGVSGPDHLGGLFGQRPE